PSAKMRGVPEPAALHVIVFDLSDQFRPQRFPREILPLTPAALAAGDALLASRPMFPRMIRERILPIRREILCKFAASDLCKACTNPNVVQRAIVVEQTQKQRAHRLALACLVPAKTANDAIAIPLMLNLEHHALVRLENTCERFGDH